MTRRFQTEWPLVLLGSFAAFACSNPDAKVTPERAAPSTSVSVAPAPPPPPAPPQTLSPVPAFEKELQDTVRMAAIPGALLVSSGQRVGRIDGDKVEWIGRIPSGGSAVRGNHISRIGGRWPDQVYAIYSSSSGRAPMPAYWPVKGGGSKVEFAPGGGAGWIAGVAQVGESTLVAGYDFMSGHRIERTRGPKIERKQQKVEAADCDKKKLPKLMVPPAVTPEIFDAAADGTLFSIGRYCHNQGVAAEIWPAKGGPSKVIVLGKWLKEVDFDGGLLQGKKGALWLDAQSEAPILEYAGGAFAPLPRLKKPRKNSFVSREGELYASDGDTLFRYEAKSWKVAAHLDWQTQFDQITRQGETYWVVTRGRLYRLQKGKSLKLTSDCKTPFVYLYDVSPKARPKFTFPSTRKALAKFDGLKQISLLEFELRGRRLGLRVASRTVGQDVIAHLSKEMPKEAPRLVCYAPEKPREIVLP